jgi:hypothetical protein
MKEIPAIPSGRWEFYLILGSELESSFCCEVKMSRKIVISW